eukprot:Em0020g1074a
MGDESNVLELVSTIGFAGQFLASGQVTFMGFKADVIVWQFSERGLYCEHNTKLLRHFGPQKEKLSLGVTSIQQLPSDDLLLGTGDGTIAVLRGAPSFKLLKSAKVVGEVTQWHQRQWQPVLHRNSTAQLYQSTFQDFDPTLIRACHNTPVTDVSFPFSGNDVRVWHASSGKELLRLVVPNLTCHAVTFTPDGRAIITAWSDGKIRAFYPETARPMYTIHDAHHKGATAVACTSDSRKKVVLKETDVSVQSEMSVNGRLFAIPRNHPDKILPPLQDQVPTSIAEFPEQESSREIAAHLTIYDWNLFCNVQQMEFIYQIFGRHKFGKITTNLDHLLLRFNQIQYWVITELCREMDLQKRGIVLRKFIKIAEHCKNYNNLNSFFAIVVGLINGAVSRLHQTWKDLPPKYKRKFESFESLMDPSRNHKVLRAYQCKLQPPVVPFMPLIMKDSFFLHEGNASLSGDGLINFEKMRLVAEKIRGLCTFRQGALSQELKTHANKNPSLQFYIRELKVVDNDQTLAQMSHKAEPPRPLNL